jgi:hypothetical protein
MSSLPAKGMGSSRVQPLMAQGQSLKSIMKPSPDKISNQHS